jgi:pyruvate/2-oxoacid:ferredoxin oxidoreductase alpha subunit
MKNAREVIREAWNDYARYVGREYAPFIEEHYMEDAEIAFVTMGAYSKDAVYAAKKLRSKGIRAGVLRIRYWRPFPSQELRKALEGVRAIGALDFSYSFGSADHAGAFFNELRSALYEMQSKPVLMDFMFVGGREPSLANFMEAGRLLEDATKLGRSKKMVRWLTLRGDDV